MCIDGEKTKTEQDEDEIEAAERLSYYLPGDIQRFSTSYHFFEFLSFNQRNKCPFLRIRTKKIS